MGEKWENREIEKKGVRKWEVIKMGVGAIAKVGSTGDGDSLTSNFESLTNFQKILSL